MTNYFKFILYTTIFTCVAGCSTPLHEGTFGYDLDFLEKHQEIVRLVENKGQSQVVVVPGYQGRVMTSTSNGFEGNSYGWINYDLIASNKFEAHINVFGGEDRFWIGPEGGQYSIFFKKETEFTFDNWFTPKEIDTEAFHVVRQNDTEVTFQKKMRLVNYQDYVFDIEVNRTISIFNNVQIEKDLGIALSDGLNVVGYQSDNEIVNKGNQAWSKDTGLLSIWILGMYVPSENTTVILPYKDTLALNSSYFGTIPPDRLVITDSHVMYKGNGTARFKLGLPPKNIQPYVGSYDADNQMLTIISFTFKRAATYVSSEWRVHDDPYAGDVINSYNDGPLENGDQLGPFYELESSSSTRALKPEESIKHVQKTYHFEGDFEVLNNISKRLLHKDLNDLP